MELPSSIPNSAQLPVVGASLDIVLRDLSDDGLVNTVLLNTSITDEGLGRTACD